MGYTKFGELLRIYRIRNHEVMGDIARILNVSTPFLSAVETGKKSIPDNWVNILADHYQMSDSQKKELIDATELSKNQIKINLSQSENYKREMAVQFQRSFNEIDEETAQHIIELLNNKE